MKNHHVGFGFIMTVAVLIFSVDVSQAASGLAAYWPFNEGSGDTAHDASGNGNNGIITGAQWVPGLAGTALQFGGTSRVSVPDNATLDLTSVTVEAWVYSDSFIASPSGIFVTKEYGARASYRLQLNETSPNHVQFVTSNSWGAQPVGATALVNHQWHFVAGVYSNDTLKVYVDGSLDGTSVCTGTPSFSTDPLLIGYTENNTAPFNGKIDEVKIFNYELPADTIMAHYNSVEGIPTPISPARGGQSTALPDSQLGNRERCDIIRFATILQPELFIDDLLSKRPDGRIPADEQSQHRYYLLLAGECG